MNSSARLCDLTVGQWVALDRGIWISTLLVQAALTAVGGWLFIRWRRRRAEALRRLRFEAIEDGPISTATSDG